MTDWSNLRDAYGAADAVPALLHSLAPDAEDDAWSELWSRLCHQDTVYSASFAALPALEAMANAWPPDKRLAPIALGAAIVASNDRFDIQGDPLRELEPTVARLHSSALESVTAAQWSATDFIYLLQAVRAFEGDHVWGRHLNHLVDGEFITTCAQCGVDLYVVIGEGGCFATAEDWVRNPTARRELIEPSRDRLPEVGEWLRTRANAAGQRTLAAQLPYLFGRTQCPSCGQPLDVAATISQLS